MNLRILKKLSKRAMPLLIALGDTWPQQFLSDGEEATVGMRLERKHMSRFRCRNPDLFSASAYVRARTPGDRPWIAFMWARPAWRGTPMVGGRFGYEEPEWEERTAWEHLVDHVANSNLIVDEEGELAWGPRLRNARHVLSEAAKLSSACMSRPRTVTP